MAEMYGELMEFNDHLHKEVQLKDNQLIKMAQTLHLAAIPVCVKNFLLMCVNLVAIVTSIT